MIERMRKRIEVQKFTTLTHKRYFKRNSFSFLHFVLDGKIIYGVDSNGAQCATWIVLLNGKEQNGKLRNVFSFQLLLPNLYPLVHVVYTIAAASIVPILHGKEARQVLHRECEIANARKRKEEGRERIRGVPFFSII